jgi:hypothetical protein
MYWSIPGADQEANVPSSAETITIAASDAVLAEFSLTLFLEVAGDLAQKLALERGTNRNRSASLIESALGHPGAIAGRVVMAFTPVCFAAQGDKLPPLREKGRRQCPLAIALSIIDEYRPRGCCQ